MRENLVREMKVDRLPVGREPRAPGPRARPLAAVGLWLAILACGSRCASTKVPDRVDSAAAAAIAGEWGVQIQMPDHAQEAVLRFTFDGRTLAGSFSEAGRDPQELTNIRLTDGKISFDVEESYGTRHFQGAADEDILSGRVKRHLPEGEGGSGFSLGGRGGRQRGGGEQDSGGSRAELSHSWTAYRRKTIAPTKEEPASSSPGRAPSPGAPLASGAAAPPALSEEPNADHRFRVSYGSLTSTETILLTPEGARVALTASFSIPAGRFVPDPFAGTCKLVTVKYTLKEDDKKSILGDRYEAPAPDSDDPLVLHPFELRNAAGKFDANSVYLLLNDSEALEDVNDLHDCTILSKDGNRYRGELMNEVACRNTQGKTFRFSEYAGKALFYSCPAPGSKPAGKRRRRD